MVKPVLIDLNEVIAYLNKEAAFIRPYRGRGAIGDMYDDQHDAIAHALETAAKHFEKIRNDEIYGREYGILM